MAPVLVPLPAVQPLVARGAMPAAGADGSRRRHGPADPVRVASLLFRSHRPLRRTTRRVPLLRRVFGVQRQRPHAGGRGRGTPSRGRRRRVDRVGRAEVQKAGAESEYAPGAQRRRLSPVCGRAGSRPACSGGITGDAPAHHRVRNTRRARVLRRAAAANRVRRAARLVIRRRRPRVFGFAGSFGAQGAAQRALSGTPAACRSPVVFEGIRCVPDPIRADREQAPCRSAEAVRIPGRRQAGGEQTDTGDRRIQQRGRGRVRRLGLARCHR